MGLLRDRKSTRLNSSHLVISYAVFCLKKKKKKKHNEVDNHDRPSKHAQRVTRCVHPPRSSSLSLSCLDAVSVQYVLFAFFFFLKDPPPPNFSPFPPPAPFPI